ncbi:MAG TPA: bifunctional DNA-binding transcriptional regulator/O6-methylguanine-DNA methyltransferase Ada [Pyrinomonadaceae bacterium]|jgi:AraC family transcriptional regulator of adaptative response/methylated-DNA-[protein]-cysteine methyltransferase|nr:bifunctional DNA-binding transcriptional regulator/O6-methylguanine-DNA methyltransferase Ada [Pyrinomonadaceae bacterium]
MNQDQNIIRELRTIEEDIYWQAVLSRDARFNGIFAYGVRSTGIYCKPSCPSRRPKREQVAFFPSCEAAEACGLRACLRCRPRETSGVDPRVELVLRVCRAIEAQTDDTLSSSSLDELGAELGMSPHHLQRTFKSITGITPRQYAAAHRLRLFKSRIKEGADVTGAMYDAGYGSSSRLYEKASERLGMTPATYRRGGKGMNINYAIVNCDLGRLLVAATERGICGVSLGDRDDALVASLAAEYPAARIQKDEQCLSEWVEGLSHYLDAGRDNPDLPLDLRATAFQLKVWEELRRIPYGETRSYKQVAEAIGQPTAARAVARACATNPVALVTPCHRVVRESGEPGGYRWGLERKRRLLEREREGPAPSNSSAESVAMHLFQETETGS